MSMGSFSLLLKAFEGKTAGNMKNACQKIAMEAFSRIIYRTPVDTGHLRSNWGCQVGNPYAGTVSAFDKAGSATVAKAQMVAAQWDGQGSIYLCNNLPYSIPIEYGHSKVKSPAGMVRVTIAEMGGVAEKVARGIK